MALYVQAHYTECLTNLPSFKAKNYRLALEESFMKIDEMMLTDHGKRELGENEKYAGCFVTVALITPNEVYCCNAGNSRTVMSKGKQAVDLSVYHKSDDSDEHRRIEAANGSVEDSRITGVPDISRALGAF